MAWFVNLKLITMMKIGRKHVIQFVNYAFSKVLADINKAEDRFLDDDNFDLDDEF